MIMTKRNNIFKNEKSNKKSNPKASKQQHFDYKKSDPHNIDDSQTYERGVVNNIFISSLNINLNLNINISIPPSPKSTKGNGSRIDTNQSIDEIKEPSAADKVKLEKMMSLRDFILRESINNESMRNEDLSVIDDEMPISTINKNLKPDYVQDLIEKIQPQICKSVA